MIDGVLTPAYGRDYKSLKDAQKDFDDGKDFRLNSYNGDCYISIRDFKEPQEIQVRYKKLTQVGFLKIKKIEKKEIKEDKPSLMTFSAVLKHKKK